MNDKITMAQIMQYTREEIERNKKEEPLDLLKEKIKHQIPPKSFRSVLSNGNSIIAEIKLKSPSTMGENLLESLTEPIIGQYEKSKAKVISIVTSKEYFGCSVKDMERIRNKSKKPILRKDFIVDEYQIYQSRAYGADAILLIVSLLKDNNKKLQEFIQLARELGMDCLIETHDKEEISMVNNIPEAKIYGINNRDLSNGFSTDLNTTRKLFSRIPKGKIIISESGVKKPQDVKSLFDVGVNAILTGTYILNRYKANRGDNTITEAINSLY